MEGKLKLQILILICFWWNAMARPSSHDEFQSLLRTVVDDQEAVAPPANSHISGPNGYCIDVKDGDYTDGNPIIIWSCTYNKVNQIWTFDSDGTLQSNGKCLTTSGYTHSSKLMIFDCNTAKKEATLWELKSNGLIVNNKTGLVITAIPGKAGTTLTVENNRYASIQTWRVDNITQPKSYSIIGYKGLCLYGSDDFVWLENCNSSNARQIWVLYRDGTIRPSHNINWCVSYDLSGRVVVVSCGLEPSSERWLFISTGYIWNERINKVVDVKSSDPSLKEIIVYKAGGTSNQKWTLKLIS